MGAIKIFAEIGYGNETICSTEIEKGDREHRIKGFLMPPKIEGIYLRFWVGKSVFVFATKNGFSFRKKDRMKLKLLFGVEGKMSDKEKQVSKKLEAHEALEGSFSGMLMDVDSKDIQTKRAVDRAK